MNDTVHKASTLQVWEEYVVPVPYPNYQEVVSKGTRTGSTTCTTLTYIRIEVRL